MRSMINTTIPSRVPAGPSAATRTWTWPSPRTRESPMPIKRESPYLQIGPIPRKEPRRSNPKLNPDRSPPDSTPKSFPGESSTSTPIRSGASPTFSGTVFRGGRTILDYPPRLGIGLGVCSGLVGCLGRNGSLGGRGKFLQHSLTTARFA